MNSANPTVQETGDASPFVHQFANGLTLLGERIENVRSAAMVLLVPAGAANDPDNALGSANVLSDWLLRGAGDRDNRALTAYLDSLGVQRFTAADTVFMRFSASMLAKNLPAVLPVYADILQRPRLPRDGFAAARDLALQQIDAMEDEPAQKLNLLLKERHFPEPFGRPTIGRREHLAALTAEALRRDFQRRFTPTGAILAFAGAIDFAEIRDRTREHLGGWTTRPAVQRPLRSAPCGDYHLRRPTNQVQIGLAYDALPESHPQSILAHLTAGVLSGGMSARLFSEIREKQGLCYTVHADYMSLKHQGAMLGYAGTAPARAQRTLDSFLFELDRLCHGVQSDELERAKIGMKSRVIMHGESSAARAAALAHDYYHYGRPRTLAELRRRIEAVDIEQLNAFLKANPPGRFTLATIGPEPLHVPRRLQGDQ